MKFLLGFAIGFGATLLFTPASGEENRRALVERAKQIMELPRQKAQQAAEAAKQKAGEIGSQVGRRAAEAAVQAVEQDVLGNTGPKTA